LAKTVGPKAASAQVLNYFWSDHKFATRCQSHKKWPSQPEMAKTGTLCKASFVSA